MTRLMWTIQAAWERCRNITRTLQGRHPLSQFPRIPLQQATISYPWLQTNHWILGENKEVKEVQLHVRVRDEPADPDAQNGIMTVSSLHNLKLEVWMPITVGET